MSNSTRSWYYNQLKDAGVQFPKHYREYSTAELKETWETLADELGQDPEPPKEQWPHEKPRGQTLTGRKPEIGVRTDTGPRVSAQPVQDHAAQDVYTRDDETPIRTDEQGRIWYREEVRKPDTPRPRARRRISYIDPGVQKQTFNAEQGFIETVETAGNQHRSAEVRITMPSYQVGLYKDPRYPFKIHVYNNLQGFDLFEVEDFFGGADMVPSTVKRTYVGNSLCYDMRTTIREIQEQHRLLVMQGRIR